MTRTPRMRHRNRQIVAIAKRPSLRIVGNFVLSLTALVAIYTLIYYALVLLDTGIKPTFDNSQAGFWDCFHFSVVTLSSLGYGDYRPTSLSRFIAGTQVVLGLVFFGLFVSRLASWKSELLLHRLIRSHLDKRLNDFRQSINKKAVELEHVLEIDIPENFRGEEKKWLLNISGRNWLEITAELSTIHRGLSRYLRYEVAKGAFYEVAPTRELGRLLGSLRFANRLCCQKQFIEKYLELERPSKRELLKHISVISENSLAIAEWIKDETDTPGLAHLADRVFEAVRELRKCYDFKMLKERE